MSCKIILERNPGIFFPGESIKGKIVCDFQNHEDSKGIMVKLRGKEQTAFSRLTSYRLNNQTLYRSIHYSGDNNFIQEEIHVVKGSTGPGSLEYPFEFVLPNQCPGSFISKNGKVRYYIQTTVEDHENVEEFSVASPIDFNIMPDLNMKPIKYQDEKVLSYCCYSSGPYSMDLNLEKEGFVLGEAMRLRIHVTNMTSIKIAGLHIELKLHIEEKSTTPSDNREPSENLIAAINDTGVGAHGERDYDLLLKIPAETVLPNFTSCTLFETWSILKVEAELPGRHKNLTIETRVTLGHIPQDTGTEKGLTVIGGAKDPADPPGRAISRELPPLTYSASVDSEKAPPSPSPK